MFARLFIISILVMSAFTGVFGQTSEIQFWDITGLKPTGKIGWTDSSSGHLFLGTASKKDLVTIDSIGNVITKGNISANKFYKGNTEFDSVKLSNLADSCKKIPDGSITANKISVSLKLKDVNIDSLSWSKIKDKPDISSLSGILLGSRVTPNFSGRAIFDSDTLTKSTPGYANRIDMYNSAINLVGYPIVACAPSPGGVDYGMMFGKPEGYTGVNADQTTFYFRAAIHNSGTTTMVLSDNLVFQSKANDSNTTFMTNVGPINIVPKTGVLKVNGIAVYSSDSLLKKNIVTIDSALIKILQIRGVKFDFRCNEFPNKCLPTGKQVGVVAQEIEKILPELVYTDNDGYKTVAYDRFSAILIEGVKEQQKIINDLTSKIAEQQQCMENQKGEIDKIKSLLGIK